MATSTKKAAVAGRLLLENVLGYHLRRAQLRLFSDFAAAMAELPLTPMLLGTMMIVDEHPGINQSDIATILGADRSTLVRLVDQLEELGFVIRRPDPVDLGDMTIGRPLERLELAVGVVGPDLAVALFLLELIGCLAPEVSHLDACDQRKSMVYRTRLAALGPRFADSQ